MPIFQEKCLSLRPEQEYFIFLTCERPRVERYSKLLCGYIGFGRPAGTALFFCSCYAHFIMAFRDKYKNIIIKLVVTVVGGIIVLMVGPYFRELLIKEPKADLHLFGAMADNGYARYFRLLSSNDTINIISCIETNKEDYDKRRNANVIYFPFEIMLDEEDEIKNVTCEIITDINNKFHIYEENPIQGSFVSLSKDFKIDDYSLQKTEKEVLVGDNQPVLKHYRYYIQNKYFSENDTIEELLYKITLHQKGYSTIKYTIKNTIIALMTDSYNSDDDYFMFQVYSLLGDIENGYAYVIRYKASNRFAVESNPNNYYIEQLPVTTFLYPTNYTKSISKANHFIYYVEYFLILFFILLLIRSLLIFIKRAYQCLYLPLMVNKQINSDHEKRIFKIFFNRIIYNIVATILFIALIWLLYSYHEWPIDHYMV